VFEITGLDGLLAFIIEEKEIKLAKWGTSKKYIKRKPNQIDLMDLFIFF
jgi:hypothetical protein